MPTNDLRGAYDVWRLESTEYVANESGLETRLFAWDIFLSKMSHTFLNFSRIPGDPLPKNIENKRNVDVATRLKMKPDNPIKLETRPSIKCNLKLKNKKRRKTARVNQSTLPFRSFVRSNHLQHNQTLFSGILSRVNFILKCFRRDDNNATQMKLSIDCCSTLDWCGCGCLCTSYDVTDDNILQLKFPRRWFGMSHSNPNLPAPVNCCYRHFFFGPKKIESL